jgi:predicted transposase YbfD/YdcC
MGCQRDIAAKIIAKKADYILALKGNQGTLCEDVTLFINEQKTKGFTDTTITTHRTLDADHGRIETRVYTAIHHVAWLQARHKWPGLKGLLMVTSQRDIGARTECETRLYITSLSLEASLSQGQ